MVAERRVAHKRLDQVVFHWEKADRQPNEAMDTFVYASAAAIKHGVNWISDQGWQKLRKQRETPPNADKPPVIGPVTAAQQAEMSKKPTLAGRLAR